MLCGNHITRHLSATSAISVWNYKPYGNAGTACYLEARSQPGLIWEPYEHKLGLKKEVKMRSRSTLLLFLLTVLTITPVFADW